MDEIPLVIDARHMGGHRVRPRFTDGREGTVDLGPHVRTRPWNLFEALLDESFFARFEVDTESGTVVWPNGVDWDPLVLYSLATGASLPGGSPA